ncbi:MAG TPA: hypothetical protein VGV61_01590 [Thermoanaerobaculia bacterium]|nr:hypothetical protein [Thermoanaerobaculia bacterium]
MTAVPGNELRLACFVTPHGFGHAARACAVLAALAARRPLAVELFTTVPEWFFRDSLALPFTCHAVRTDVGLAQRDALDEDLPATVRELDAFLPFDSRLVARLAATVRERGCAAALCDVAPLGIAVARAAGLPVALVENFTWDWIYAAYGDRTPGLRPHADYLFAWFAGADLRVQSEPVCRPWAGAVRVPPVARVPRRRRDETRARLGITPEQRAVLVTMGGIRWDYGALVTGTGPSLPPGVVLVVPGGAPESHRLLDSAGQARALLLPFHSDLYHPDLVAAADAVVGKLGYSTLAECWTAGVPFGFIPRHGFPESPVLEEALRAAGAGVPVPADALRHAAAASSWAWLDEVLALPRLPAGRVRGNDAAAAALDGWLVPAVSG